MERGKSDLEKEIAAIFKRHTKKGRESDVAGVINGVLSAYFRELETGTWTLNSTKAREEIKENAFYAINGFLWAMDAMGLINDEKRSKMYDQLFALRYQKPDAAAGAERHELKQS